jgi:dihydropteroate synthase
MITTGQPMRWRARQFEYHFPRSTLIMGILNVTPDSFFDGGRFLDPAGAVDRALEMIGEGADLIDVGGESTRPGAAPVALEEELKRVLPVLRSLAGRVRVPVSVDTMKVEVARAALDAGASILNDVSARREDPALWELAGRTGAGYVAMHMQGTPRTMQENPVYEQVTAEVDRFFGDRLDRLNQAGVDADQVVLDVGIGFGKQSGHNLELLARLATFTKRQRPLLLGASRKSFIGQITGSSRIEERLAGSLACACWAVAAGARIIRTHDVAATKQAVQMTEAVLATQAALASQTKTTHA